jgi:hypothetical protein
MATLLFNTDLHSVVSQYTEIPQHDWLAHSFPFISSCHSLTLNCCFVTQKATWLDDLRRLFVVGTWHWGGIKCCSTQQTIWNPNQRQQNKTKVKWHPNHWCQHSNWKYTVFANYWNTVLLAAILYNLCSTWFAEVWYLCSKTDILVRIGKVISYKAVPNYGTMTKLDIEVLAHVYFQHLEFAV